VVKTIPAGLVGKHEGVEVHRARLIELD
jgi:hypothetical protein